MVTKSHQKNNLIKIIGALFLGLLIAAPIFVKEVWADTTSTLNVGLTIPATNTPPGGGGGGGNNSPVISNIAISSSHTTSTISWQATDDQGISNVAFIYGVTTGYGSVGNIVGTYAVNLSGLTPGQTYYYEITVTDTGGISVIQNGSFVTVALDITAPNILNITVVTSSNSSTISWNTNEAADSQLQYGTTAAYGQDINDAAFNLSRSVTINGLQPVTQYHFRIIATDSSGNATTTQDRTFTTGPDAVPPPDVTGLTITPTTSTISLTWANPTVQDWLNVRLVRKAGSLPVSPADGTLLYTGTASLFTDLTAVQQVNYYYIVYSYDTSGNHSGGTFVNGQLDAIPAEVCNNNIDDDFDGATDCSDTDCSAAPVCAPPKVEICGNSIDDDLNGKTDCADAACASLPACVVPPAEICGNGIDDNSNGLVDCADSACASNSACVAPPGGGDSGGGGGGGTVTPIEICNNNIDDNNNGFTDCTDLACYGFPGCKASTSTPGQTTGTPSSTSYGSTPVRTPDDLKFQGGNRQIEITPISKVLVGLSGMDYTIIVPSSQFYSRPETVSATIAGENHAFSRDQITGDFYADIVFPQIGEYESLINVSYSQKENDKIILKIKSLAHGQVVSGGKGVDDVTVTLYPSGSNDYFDTGLYGEPNPIQTTVNGTYGWVVPNGRYYITAIKDGYYSRKTPVFEVKNNIINQKIELIELPPKLDLNPENIIKNVEAVAQVGLQVIADTLVELKDFADNKQVEAVMTSVVVPSVVGVVAVGTVSIVSWANIIPLLQLLFLQPFAFFGQRKKRSAWGQVYNSLNKQPVDLASVRLINDETSKVIQSKVTDSQGRYAFIANAGKYRIEVTKNNFVFPSDLLHEARTDGQKIDIYHGEVIEVTEKDAMITANIPLDPKNELTRPTRVRFRSFARNFQMIIWWFGFLITIFALYISPKPIVWVTLAVQLVFYGLLKLMARPPKIKNWGIVYDITSKRPIERVITRLFNAKFNKLVASQVTDNAGRYYFLAGDDEYFVTYEHPLYSPHRTRNIDLKGNAGRVINVDVELRPQDMPESRPDDIIAPPEVLK